MKRNIVLLVAGLTIVLAATPASALVHIVNCGGGAGVFPTIAAAVGAAGPGDTIVVEPCAVPYNGFTVFGMTDLHIVGAGYVGAMPEGVGAPSVPPVVISDPVNSCIFIDASLDVSVLGFLLDGCGGDGVRVRNSQHIVVEGNVIGAAVGAGISDVGSFNSRITGNTTNGALVGIWLIDTVESLVNDNVVVGSRADGIFVDGPLGNHTKIFNNEVMASFNLGIALLGGNSHRAQHNTVTGSMGAADVFCAGGAFNAALIANAGLTTNLCGADFY